MLNFNYFTPTKIVFGKGAEAQVGALVKAQGGTKVLLHYGGGSAQRSGLLDKIQSSLQQEGIAYRSLGGVVPNPRLSLVYEGIRICREEHIDFILAVGGGSVIDSAKAIGFGVASKVDVWELFNHTAQADGCLPIGVVLTIAAAGSEMSGGAVITKDEGGIKRDYSNDACRAKFAILDPALTMTLPDEQTAYGCTDILMHTMERYFTDCSRREVTDGIAEALMRTVIRNAQILRKDPQNYDARAEIMWAGSLSHNGLTGCGTDGGDWATHMLEHEVGGMFDVPHGAGLAALWGSWARYVYKDCLSRFVPFATRVMDIAPQGTPEKCALAGIAATENFFRSLGMPTSLAELGLHPSDEQMAEMAHKCSLAVGGKIGTAKVLYEADMLAIYRMAR